jgi:AraC-like DNA-binding protein
MAHSVVRSSPGNYQVWDDYMSNLLQMKPVLCFHHVHQHFQSRMHSHLGVEFLFCKSGNGILNVNGKAIPYNGPVLVQLNGSTPHRVDVGNCYERWNLAIEYGALPELVRTTNNPTVSAPIRSTHDFSHVGIIPVASKLVGRVENTFIDIADEIADSDVYSEQIIKLQLYRLSYYFERLIHDAGIVPVPTNEPDSVSVQDSLDICSFIQVNLDRELSAKSIAQELHYSENHVYRLVRNATGLSLNTYVKQQRIKRAQAMLTNTDLPIAQIGEAVGITHPVHFSRTFRSLTGLSPSAFRDKRQTEYYHNRPQ